MFATDYPIAWSFHRNTCRWQRIVPPLPPERGSVVTPFKEYPGAPFYPLPAAELPAIPLSEVLARRYSCRDFASEPLSLQQLSVLLQGGYGIKGMKTFDTLSFFERMVPSGGALYPLELYLLVRSVEGLPQGIYHFSIYPAALEQVRPFPFSALYIRQLFMNQPYVADSSVILVATSFFQRNLQKYGDRGYRYSLFEAGHVFQNINLLATAAGLGTLNLGGFFDSELAGLLQLDLEAEMPLYAMAIGVPAEGGAAVL